MPTKKSRRVLARVLAEDLEKVHAGAVIVAPRDCDRGGCSPVITHDNGPKTDITNVSGDHD